MVHTVATTSAATALNEAQQNEIVQQSKYPTLQKFLETADRTQLVQAITNLINTHPATYSTISSLLRLSPVAGLQQFVLLRAELNSLEQSMLENCHCAKHCSEFEEALEKLLNCIRSNPADAKALEDRIALAEFAIERVLSWRSILTLNFEHDYERKNICDDAISELIEVHVDLLKKVTPDSDALIELLLSWYATYSFVIQDMTPTLENYARFIETSSLLRHREQIEEQWFSHCDSGLENCSHESDCLLKHLMRAIVKSAGLSDALKNWIQTELEDGTDYVIAFRLLQYCNLEYELSALLDQAVKNLHPYDAADMILHEAQRRMDAEDKASVSQLCLDALKLYPTSYKLLDIKSVLEARCEDEEYIELANEWKHRAIEFLRDHLKDMPKRNPSGKHLEANSTLIELLLDTKQLEEALQCSELGCTDSTSSRLFRILENSPEISARLIDVLKSKIAIELSNGNFDEGGELLQRVFRSISTAEEKKLFQEYCKELRERFNLKGKRAKILRNVGF